MGSGSAQWILPCPNPKTPCNQVSKFPQIIPATTTPVTRDNNQNKDSQCQSNRLVIGMFAQVAEDSLLVIRSKPYAGSVIGHSGPMSIVNIINGPECAGGAVWWEVSIATQSLTGWATEANLRACSKEDSCT